MVYLHPISVVAQRESNGNRLDVTQFCSINLHGELLEMCGRSGIREDMAVGAWIKSWKHWGLCSAAECETSSPETDMCNVCVFKEAIYERKLSELIASLLVRNAHPEMHEDGAPVSSSIELVVLRWPFEHSWVFHAYEHWQKDVDFEVRRTVPSRGVRIFAEWDNVEVFSLPPADSVSLYVWCRVVG